MIQKLKTSKQIAVLMSWCPQQLSTAFGNFEVRHPRCVNQITNMADVQSKHNYIYYSYRWYT